MAKLRFENRMSDADALMWSIEKDPLLRSTMIGVLLFDQPLDRSRLIQSVDRLSRVVPRFRQRVHAPPLSIAPPRWEIDPHFDLSYHVRYVSPAGGGSLRDLLDLAAPIAMQGFDRARPLWELHIVEGLDEGKAATILKMHHSITDGVGAVQIFAHLVDLDREGIDRGPMPPEPDPDPMSQWEYMRDAIGHERRRAMGILGRLGANAAQSVRSLVTNPTGVARSTGGLAASAGRMLAPAGEPLSDVMTGRSLSIRFDTMRLPLNDLKRAAKAAGGKLNDAFVAGVIGGMRRYHLAHGSEVAALRMGMPINIREGGAPSGGNQFIPSRFVVPLDIDDPVERMQAINELVAQQRSEPAMSLFEPVSTILRRLPTGTTTALFGSMMRGVDFQTSNVPGVNMPVYQAGAMCEGQYGYGPLAGAAANITLFSYLDEVFIAISTNAGAVPDAEVLVDNLRDGFDEVLKAG